MTAENVSGDLDTVQVYGIDEDTPEIECTACEGFGWDCGACWGTGMVEVDAQ